MDVYEDIVAIAVEKRNVELLQKAIALGVGIDTISRLCMPYDRYDGNIQDHVATSNMEDAAAYDRYFR